MRAERRGFFVLASVAGGVAVPAAWVAMLWALRLLPRFCRVFVRLDFFFLSRLRSSLSRLRSSSSSLRSASFAFSLAAQSGQS